MPNKIFVRAPNWIGDQVLAYPFFHRLRALYPQSFIGVQCLPWVADLQYRDLINDVYVLPPMRDRTWSGRLQWLWKAGQQAAESGPWDLAISLPNSFSSAWMVWRSGAAKRVGYRTEGRGMFLTHALDWEREGASNHRSEAYLKLLGERAPFHFTGGPVDPVKSFPNTVQKEPPFIKYWVVAPGSAADSRRWPVERFAELIRILNKKEKFPVVVVGGKSEAELGSYLKKNLDTEVADWTASGSVASLGKLFSRATLTLTNDSGLAHVASLFGSKVQVIWGAGNPARTRAVGAGEARIYTVPVECWPCERNRCMNAGSAYNACLKGIEAEPVADSIQSWLEEVS